MNKYKVAGLFGVCHGVNDFIAGYLLACLSWRSSDWKMNSVAFLLYSVIAFGGQLPAGIIVDRSKNIRLFSLIALALMIFSISVFYVNIFAAILFSGMASALIHVCGGAACYVSDSRNSTLAGIFTSPGVAGLITGGIAGTMHFNYFFILIALLLPLFVLMQKIQIPSYSTLRENKEESILETHDLFMLILLMAIAFRSLLWNIVHMMCYDNTQWLLGIALSASAGKLIGGYLTDKVNWKKFVFVSMIGSVILLNAGKNFFPVFLVGVALLQSAVPITLLLMQNAMQNSPATATGLTLGLAIVLAGLPTYLDQFRIAKDNKIFILLISLTFLVSNFWIIRKAKPLA